MVLTVDELCTNKNFILKIAVLICGISVIFLDWPVLSNTVSTCELSYLAIISALVIAYMFFESTPATEICLLCIALVAVIEAIPTYIVLCKDPSRIKFYSHLGLDIVVIIIIAVDIWLLVKVKIDEISQTN